MLEPRQLDTSQLSLIEQWVPDQKLRASTRSAWALSCSFKPYPPRIPGSLLGALLSQGTTRVKPHIVTRRLIEDRHEQANVALFHIPVGSGHVLVSRSYWQLAELPNTRIEYHSDSAVSILLILAHIVKLIVPLDEKSTCIHEVPSIEFEPLLWSQSEKLDWLQIPHRTRMLHSKQIEPENLRQVRSLHRFNSDFDHFSDEPVFQFSSYSKKFRVCSAEIDENRRRRNSINCAVIRAGNRSCSQGCKIVSNPGSSPGTEQKGVEVTGSSSAAQLTWRRAPLLSMQARRACL